LIAIEKEREQVSSTKAKAIWDIEVFFDGDCPLCRREIAMLRRMDRHHRILFTDIADEEFSPGTYEKTQSEFMERIHGRLPDGTWVEGVEVFRRLYAAVGLSWIVAVTRLPILSHLLDFGYRFFAKNRLKWTGRCGTGSACEVVTAESRQSN
jgi:predicted DCC family thiol-disulfide oxidoreductase YuxK